MRIAATLLKHILFSWKLPALLFIALLGIWWQTIAREKINRDSAEIEATLTTELVQLQKLISKLQASDYPKEKTDRPNENFYEGLTPDLKSNLIQMRVLTSHNDGSGTIKATAMLRASKEEASLLFTLDKKEPINISQAIKAQKPLILLRRETNSQPSGSVITIVFPGKYFEVPNKNAVAIADLRPHWLLKR